MPPRVSVVIPTYNRRHGVVEAIDSVLAQTVADFEILVIDDGSADGTPELLHERYGDEPRVRVHIKENGGTASARNRGIELASGAFIAFLDSDDLYVPSFLERQVQALDSHPKAAMAICDAKYEGGWRPSWTTILARAPAPQDIQQMCDGAWALPIQLLVRADVATALMFDLSVKIVEDTEFFFRFFLAGHKAIVVPEVLALYRKEVSGSDEAQKTTTSLPVRRERLALLARYAEHARNPRRHRARIERGWTKICFLEDERSKARPHIRRWWRLQPLQLSAPWYLLRSFF
jgi:glycosyltransferase involved in cell wall biosynthesis